MRWFSFIPRHWLIIVSSVLFVSVSLAAPPHAESEKSHPTDQPFTQIADCHKAYIEKALLIKKTVDADNRNDISILESLLQDQLKTLSDEERAKLVQRVIAKLKADKSTFIQIKAALDAKPKTDYAARGSYPLRTSLGKLIGTKQYKGILDDVIEWLSASPKDNPLYGDNLESLKPTHNKITVLKTLLVYTNIVLRDQNNLTAFAKEHNIGDRIRLCYPTQYPDHLKKQWVGQLGLHCDTEQYPKRIFVPNAGFIYGGNFFEGKCRGVDCSAFISHCSDSSIRLWTGAWEEIAKYYLISSDTLTAAKKEKRQTLLEADWFQKGISEYRAVDTQGGESIQPADIIVWRWTTESGGRAGHVVMFLESNKEKDGEFLGIEANRFDDKSREGLLISSFKLKRTNADTFVLRRKSP